MKNKLNIVLFLFLLCLSFGLGSCTDEMSDEGGEGDEKITLRVQLSTRADAGNVDTERLNAHEYRIKRIRLYAFDGNVLDNMVYKSYRTTDEVTGTVSIDIKVKPGNNKTFYAVVNEPDDEAIHTALALANHPNGIQQVQYTIAEYLNSNVNAITQTADYFLPMYRETTFASVSKTTTSLEIGVNRAVARVDIYMMKANGVTSSATTDKATLTVEHSAREGYIAENNVALAEPSQKFNMDHPNVETLNTYSESDASKYKKIYSFYVPEQSCTEEGERLKFTLGGITWNGVLMPQPYNDFYLGNDINNSAGAKLNKIERNKVYQLYCRIKPTSKDVELTIITQPWNLAPVQNDESEKGEVNMVNCYIVAPGGGTIIPVSNVYKIWSWVDELDRDYISKDKTVVPEVIWTDTENLITSVSLLPSGGSIDDKDHARIKVQTASGKHGNAVIGIRMKDKDGNMEEGYRWSWHIWVTSYDPFNKSITSKGVTFMDRNLGALTNEHDLEGTVQGLIYQWGRKDPFPTNSGNSNGLDWDGPEAHYGKNIVLTSTTEETNIVNAIKNPYIFYFNTALLLGDWYTNNSAKQNNLLWRNDLKTIYDPCPEGWRVPSTQKDIWTGRELWHDWVYGDNGIITDDIGYYPYASQRQFKSGILLKIEESAFWFTAPFEKNLIFASLLVYNGGQNPRISGKQRSMGNSVRCVKE